MLLPITPFSPFVRVQALVITTGPAAVASHVPDLSDLGMYAYHLYLDAGQHGPAPTQSLDAELIIPLGLYESKRRQQVDAIMKTASCAYTPDDPTPLKDAFITALVDHTMDGYPRDEYGHIQDVNDSSYRGWQLISPTMLYETLIAARAYNRVRVSCRLIPTTDRQIVRLGALRQEGLTDIDLYNDRQYVAVI